MPELCSPDRGNHDIGKTCLQSWLEPRPTHILSGLSIRKLLFSFGYEPRPVGLHDRPANLGQCMALLARSRRLAFQRVAGAFALGEQRGQPGQGFVQFLFQRPRRVDDKHAAAMHAEAVPGRRLDLQRGMQPVAGTE